MLIILSVFISNKWFDFFISLHKIPFLPFEFDLKCSALCETLYTLKKIAKSIFSPISYFFNLNEKLNRFIKVNYLPSWSCSWWENKYFVLLLCTSTKNAHDCKGEKLCCHICTNQRTISGYFIQLPPFSLCSFRWIVSASFPFIYSNSKHAPCSVLMTMSVFDFLHNKYLALSSNECKKHICYI